MLKSLKTLSLLADGEDPLSIDSEMGKPEVGELVASFTNFEVLYCVVYYPPLRESLWYQLTIHAPYFQRIV